MSAFKIAKWEGQSMCGPFALDTETENIVIGLVPKLVLWTAYDGRGVVFYGDHTNIHSFMRINWHHTCIMHNAPFDLSVIANNEVDGGYPEFDFVYGNIDHIQDISIFWRLLWLAKDGKVPEKYNLALITKYCTGHTMNKSDDVRMDWFRGIDLTKERLEYACEDAFYTYLSHERLYKGISKQPQMLSYGVQIRGDIALDDLRRRGIGINKEAAQALVQKFTDEMDTKLPAMAAEGYVPKEPGNTKILQGYVRKYIVEHGIEKWPLTTSSALKNFFDVHIPVKKVDKETVKKAKKLKAFTGDPSKLINPVYATSAEVLEKFAKTDVFLNAYLDHNAINKSRSFLIDVDSDRLYPKYNLLVDTGRTSCRNPNIQNQPRAGGIRECFRPTGDNSFVIVDYNFLELCTLAQICYTAYGFSKMRDVINIESENEKDYDPHWYMAKSMIKEATKKDRQKAKAINFGFPGGLGIDAFVEYAFKTYGVLFTVDEAKQFKEAWKSTFPEMYSYLSSNGEDTFNVRTETGRLRSKCIYTQAKNTPFQGLAADGAKYALWEGFKKRLPMVAFVHDEIIIDTDKPDIDRPILEECMIVGMKRVVKDVRIRVEGKVCKQWEK